MGIDKETKPRYINIVFPENKETLKLLREQAESDGQNDGLEKGDSKMLSITTDVGSFEVEEYYFDESNGTIEYTGQINNGKDKIWVGFSFPLSDVVLIDILQHSMKKLAKLKTALETLR